MNNKIEKEKINMNKKGSEKRRNKNKKKSEKGLALKVDNERLISAPIAQSISFTTRRPKILNDGQRYCVRHRELIAEISGSVNFTIQANFVINPGFASTFPWLSPIANQWEQYHFKELSFHYIGRCPTTFSGSIMLVPEYDILDADPTSKVQASTYLGAVEQSPWTNFSCKLESRSLQPMGPKKYVRSGPVLGDLKTYDGGKFLVISQGQVDSSICGDLWVEYDLELSVPQSGTSQSPPSSTSTISVFTDSVAQSVTAGTDVLFATVAQNPLSISYAAGVFTPMAGTYRIDWSLNSISVSTGFTAYFNGSQIVYGTSSAIAGGNTYMTIFQTFSGSETFSLRNTGSTSQVQDRILIFTLV